MVELTVSDGVAEIVLARVEARNAIDAAWVQAFAASVDACVADERIRAVLIRAEGPAFTVGGDLAHFAARADRLAEELTEMIGTFHTSLLRLGQLPVPVLCAAHGAVAGGGLGLLWAADVVLLADDARLATAFARLGLSGDGGSSWYLPRLLGLRRALQLMVQGRVLTAHEAVEWQLADRVVPQDELLAEARMTAQSLAAGPTRAYGEMRRLIRGALDVDLAGGLGAELQAMGRLGATADARGGRDRLHRAPDTGLHRLMNHGLVRSLYAALASGDRDAVEALLDPDFYAEFTAGLPLGIGGTHTGTDAIDRGWWAIGAAFAIRANPEQYIDTTDGRLLVIGRYVGHARTTRRPVDAAFAHLWTAVDGRLTALTQITDSARWAQALGASDPQTQ